ncbi:ACP S-malonyltransferase [Glaciecola siphonariae]|uniref:Malonyl CoA-acyl carrier protein transacylase n=1 Tax=Glaciecola siphonariae TaxID=521012 RepID=A0ABV9LV09_9ALTE
MSKLACVFPGQGSQSVGMLADLAANFSSVNATFEEASDTLGYDLWEVAQTDKQARINQTQVTQPVLLTASIAAWRVLCAEKPIEALFLAGHSLGEYTALVAAGVLSLTDAVKLVESRGKFMQSAVPEGTGAMYAIIGLDDDKIKDTCVKIANETSQVVAPVNFNSPGQIVIAGDKEATDLAGAACKEAGAKRALPLAVSVPSHCALMKPAAEQLATALAQLSFNVPRISVVNNADVCVENTPDAIKQALVKQLYSPVRWTESIEFLREQGIDTIIEVGPGKVLSGLNKRIDKTLNLSSFSSPADL